MSPAQQAFVAACRAEIEAPKPGNVHIFAGGHDMEARHFLLSAEAAGGPLTEAGAPVGRRIRRATEASLHVAGTNTNLGIILLCGPLAAAFESARPAMPLPRALDHILDALTVDDSRDVFAAIRLANPGGMGKVEGSDLSLPPTAALRQIMTEALDRDRIAKAYADGFADVFDTGLPALAAAREAGAESWWPATFTYLTFLSRFPDSHIMRKWGAEAAQRVQGEAQALLRRVTAEAAGSRLNALLAFDDDIKARGLNPGTSADLTVATLFAESLINILQQGPESG